MTKDTNKKILLFLLCKGLVLGVVSDVMALVMYFADSTDLALAMLAGEIIFYIALAVYCIPQTRRTTRKEKISVVDHDVFYYTGVCISMFGLILFAALQLSWTENGSGKFLGDLERSTAVLVTLLQPIAGWGLQVIVKVIYHGILKKGRDK